ncbi:hypothetical protein BJY04DRAFT_213213 [Aspergillus karnatakaensis]|uniref:uncharacterized protein n=1 Tax=Aspergillus karnatakaensis TaxID=1810916 RepID=UPI003CCD2D18
MAFAMRQAEPSDLDTVLSLLENRVTWLHEKGTAQWQTSIFHQRLASIISRGETWLLLDEAQTPVQAVGTVTVQTEGDPGFWYTHELQTPALYISKMATRVDRRGEGLGRLIVSWCSDFAARRGMVAVRWDAWRTNSKLHDYYVGIGARFLRMAGDGDGNLLHPLPARASSYVVSGALFEVSPVITDDLPVSTRFRSEDTPQPRRGAVKLKQYLSGYDRPDNMGQSQFSPEEPAYDGPEDTVKLLIDRCNPGFRS